MCVIMVWKRNALFAGSYDAAGTLAILCALPLARGSFPDRDLPHRRSAIVPFGPVSFRRNLSASEGVCTLCERTRRMAFHSGAFIDLPDDPSREIGRDDAVQGRFTTETRAVSKRRAKSAQSPRVSVQRAARAGPRNAGRRAGSVAIATARDT
ncbi:hypothetical protein EV657_108117 [Rhodovulum visakhapatnamense]|uniref:Uncharacterized protein n=1 Tax=Rhodovulum visakhapatnamense TaxID=364297 RepID=A0A4R8FVW3_9RHOB|nr:hypothetical protein EV657_108117 [Rhodovulum visakhapatnamense]